jgi:hypothetical protein
MATLPMPDAIAGRSCSLYWKLNSTVLDNPAFRPSFKATWRPVLAAKPVDPAGVAAWWDSHSQAFLCAFCQRFSKVLAAKRLQNRRSFTKALELALASSDWAPVRACRNRLREMDAWAACGAAVHSQTLLVADELASLYHIAAESSLGSSPGLCSVSNAEGVVLTEPEAVKREIFSFYEAIFQGRHEATAGADAPVDSGVSFVPDEALFDRFLPGLLHLSRAQRDSLEAPLHLQRAGGCGPRCSQRPPPRPGQPPV